MPLRDQFECLFAFHSLDIDRPYGSKSTVGHQSTVYTSPIITAPEEYLVEPVTGESQMLDPESLRRSRSLFPALRPTYVSHFGPSRAEIWSLLLSSLEVLGNVASVPHPCEYGC